MIIENMEIANPERGNPLPSSVCTHGLVSEAKDERRQQTWRLCSVRVSNPSKRQNKVWEHFKNKELPGKTHNVVVASA